MSKYKNVCQKFRIALFETLVQSENCIRVLIIQNLIIWNLYYSNAALWAQSFSEYHISTIEPFMIEFFASISQSVASRNAIFWKKNDAVDAKITLSNDLQFLQASPTLLDKNSIICKK